MLHCMDAKAAAQFLVDELKAQKAQKEREWAELAKKTKVKRNKEGIAVIHCSTKATDVKPSKNVEVLLERQGLDQPARQVRKSLFGARRSSYGRNQGANPLYCPAGYAI